MLRNVMQAVCMVYEIMEWKLNMVCVRGDVTSELQTNVREIEKMQCCTIIIVPSVTVKCCHASITHNFQNKQLLLRNIGVRWYARSRFEQKNSSTFSNLIMSMEVKQKQTIKTPAYEVFLKILGNGSPAEPASMILSTNYSKYLFQCGQGVQRLLSEQSVKLPSIKCMFVTHRSWEKVGGLPGMVITVKDVDMAGKLRLQGPPHTMSFLTDVPNAMICEESDIDRPAYDSVYCDETVTIRPVPLFGDKLPAENFDMTQFDSTMGDLEEEDDSNMFDDDVATAKVRRSDVATAKVHRKDVATEKVHLSYKNIRNQEKQNQLAEELKARRKLRDQASKKPKNASTCDIALAYVCELAGCLGKISLEKCREKKVPVGPLIGQLKQGEQVTLEDGSIVLPEDVKGPDQPGSSFIVVDCVNEGFLSSLVTELSASHVTSSGRCPLTTVVHFTPRMVMDTQQYTDWMRSLPEGVSHVVANESCSAVGGCESVYRHQTWLNQLSDRIHPLLPTQCATDNTPVENSKHRSVSNLTYATCGMTIWLRPQFKIVDEVAGVISQPQQYLDTLKTEEPEFDKTLRTMQKKVEELAKSSYSGCGGERSYPELVFLGTASACPTKARNVSGILLHLDEDTCMLMDCGEGTLGQIRRFYGAAGADEILRKLKCIFISHKHADHHMGLANVLRERERLMRGGGGDGGHELWLCAPRNLASFMKYCISSFIDLHPLITSGFQYIPNNSWMNPSRASELRDREDGEARYDTHYDMLRGLRLRNLETVYARHMAESYSLVLYHKDGWKLVYSGDTMPNDVLVDAGKDCDILIHESTFGNEKYLREMALEKKHSTQQQAVEIGQKMKAKFTILTHFSGRMNKLPPYKFNESVGIAFDMMKVNINNLWQLPYFANPLKSMFSTHINEMENRDFRKQLKIELLKSKSYKI